MNDIIIIVSTASFTGLLFIIYGLHQRIKKLEQPQKGRRTVADNAGFEDLSGVSVELAEEMNVWLARMSQVYATGDYILARFEKINEIAKIMRKSPHAYDPDRPAGKRPQGME